MFLSAVMIFNFFFFWWVWVFFPTSVTKRKKKSNLDGINFFPQLLIFPDTGVTYNKLLLFSD